jgi:hypothetical protein
VTNYGTRAILGLPKMPERQLRFLLGLETFTGREDGWREAGTALLASTAGLSVNTAARARVELVKSGAIEYRRGNGRGQVGPYRIKVPSVVVHLPEPGKVPNDAGDLSGPEKVPNDAGDLSSPERYPNEPRKGTQTGLKKVPKRNAATSGNAIGALEPLALESSALPRTPARPDLRMILDGLDVDDESLMKFIVARIEGNPGIGDPAAYLLGIVGKGEDAVRGFLGQMRRALAAEDVDDDPRPLPRPDRPPYCGECDERTRMVPVLGKNPADDRMARCIHCHPLSVAAPGDDEEPARDRQSGSCRGGDHALCVWSWCACSCHRRQP